MLGWSETTLSPNGLNEDAVADNLGSIFDFELEDKKGSVEITFAGVCRVDLPFFMVLVSSGDNAVSFVSGVPS